MIKKEIKFSTEFKRETTKAILAIMLFLIVYLLIIALALGLTALCIFGAIMLVVSIPRFITLMLAIGLASLGFFVMVFLVKFIFKSHKIDRSHLTEISRQDEPKLFQTIKKIVDQVGTQFPKKIYLSSEVNASVFYNSSFFSMFLPVRKNLQVGLGLVNCVSALELEAILAHEFGHFSQRTMKVGSYVYNLNQVIYNLIYDDESFNNLMYRWAELSGYFSIFVVAAIKIIQGIQWVLRKMYEVVNISYMGLSREMEFHADEVAAHVTGSNPLATALLRLDLAEQSFNSVLNFYESKIQDGKKGDNLFNEQQFVMQFLAKENTISLTEGLPMVSEEELNKFNKSKLIIKDQWASHPSVEERVSRLESLDIPSEKNESGLANELFADINRSQTLATRTLFQNIQYPSDPVTMTIDEFREQFEQQYKENSFDSIFNGYYDNKNPSYFDISQMIDKTAVTNWAELVSSKKVTHIYSSLSLQSDIETLKQIANKQFKVKTYDYDGIRYKRTETHELIKKLTVELEKENTLIKQNDIEIFLFFRDVELKQGLDKLSVLYQNFFALDKKYDLKIEIFNKISDATQFTNFTTPFDQIKKNFREIKILEKDFKEEISTMIVDEDYKGSIEQEIEESFNKYLSKEYQYFANEVYMEENLQILFSALNSYFFVLSRSFFLKKKEILQYKKELLDAS